MESKSWLTMTPEERINELGDEPDCPFCGKPRVTRSTYIRCNPCGLNWGVETDIFRDPRMKATAFEMPEAVDGAQTAKYTPNDDHDCFNMTPVGQP